MKTKRLLVICDPEELFAVRLAEYMNQKKGFPLEAMAYSEKSGLKELAKTRDIAVLLISDVLSGGKDPVESEPELTITLSEEEQEAEGGHTLYKYQNADNLITQLMEMCADCGIKNMKGFPGKQNKGNAEILGVFSPVHRCGKTTFALALGIEKARKQRTLYLNLEDYSGFSELFEWEKKGDLSDLIYYDRMKDRNLGFKINSLTVQIQNLEIIPPAFSPWDLYGIEPEEWMGLLSRIASAGEYEVIILDIGGVAGDGIGLLGLCSRIYMPVADDAVAKAKRTHFRKLMETMGQGMILEQIREVRLPNWKIPETPSERITFLGGKETMWWIRSLEI